MDFVKMHGLGNDFVFIEDKTGQDKDYTALARAMCNRHTGIGADAFGMPISKYLLMLRF